MPRTVTARCAMTGTPLPPLRFARLIRGQLGLYLAEPAEVPTPFLPTVNPTLWVLDPDGHILDREEAEDYAAPYPSLVTIGHDLDGGFILVHLEHAGALSIDDDDTGKHEVLTALAAELATNLWSDELRVTIVGAAPDLAAVLDSGRIRHLDKAHLDRLLIDMSNRVAADRAALAEVQVPSLSVARASGVAEGAWSPEILLITQPMTDSERGRLTHLIHTNPRAAIGVVTTAGPPLSEWAIHLHSEVAGHAVLDPIGLAVTPQRVGPRDHAKMVDLFGAPAPRQPPQHRPGGSGVRPSQHRPTPRMTPVPASGRSIEVEFWWR